jgi:hypothetical protein
VYGVCGCSLVRLNRVVLVHQSNSCHWLECTEQSLGTCADGCTTVSCICKEFLLKPGIYYQNPFDSTRTTGIWCDFSQPGWYGGMLHCDGGYFDPYLGDCAAIPPTGIPAFPYKRALLLLRIAVVSDCSKGHSGYLTGMQGIVQWWQVLCVSG